MNPGRTLGGMALGALLALFAPLLLLLALCPSVPQMLVTGAITLAPAVLLPSIGLIALHRWMGRGPAMFSAVLMFTVDFLFMGPMIAFAALLASILPALLLLRWEDRPFFQQMRFSIAGFGVGMFAAVAVLYIGFGGNMIDRVLGQVPEMMRSFPAEGLMPSLEFMSETLGTTITLEDFYALYDAVIAQMITQYRLQMPECLLTGALITALACTWLSARMRPRSVRASGCYAPLRAWALPASTTGGLFLMLAASLVLRFAGMEGAAIVFRAVYGIAVTAFCVQMLASMARRLHLSPMTVRRRRVMLIVTLALCFLGASLVAAIFGCASAIFGSRGVLQQRMQNIDNDK